MKPHPNLGKWAEGLREASFREASFLVDSSESGHGRRGVKHEYPGRDTPYAEDLGRRAREYTIEAFVLGDGYMAARDALLAAIEKTGPGTLVHPTLGSLQVVVLDPARLRETTAEGGMARFSITFTEAGENEQPASAADSAQAVETAADAALGAAQDDFSDGFDVAGAPAFVADGAIANLDKAVSDLRKINGRISSALSPISNFSAQLDRLGGQLTALIQTPATLAAELAGAVTAIKGVATDVQAGFASCRALFSFGSDIPAVTATTPSRSRQATNQAAIQTFMRRAAVIEGVRISSRASYSSAVDASAVRDELLDALDGMAESASDVTYTALADLRTAMTRDLAQRVAQAPGTRQITLNRTLPAAVVAYRLYGDAERASEIVARNRIRHPGFVSGGVPLEALNA